ncbi:hypothetical protein ACH4VX_09325 [Streptomyces sp. NPDC020731]|uniref:hypothetical protein n=1 Tax=Streptomyces sp. NPDC020731 TaxID=3365085 RepID=UPI0037B71316
MAPPAGSATPSGDPWGTGPVGNVLDPRTAVFCTGLLPTLAQSGFSPHPGTTLLVLIHTALTLVRLGGYVLVPAKARASSRSLPCDAPRTASQLSS